MPDDGGPYTIVTVRHSFRKKTHCNRYQAQTVADIKELMSLYKDDSRIHLVQVFRGSEKVFCSRRRLDKLGLLDGGAIWMKGMAKR
jgi:predicted CoA-binding protein